jgi:hypothetical protein
LVAPPVSERTGRCQFPADFDGIIAGAPGLNYTGGQIARVYWKQALAANPFPAAKLNLLAARVYERCDAQDGLKDGVIDNPLRCDFRAARDLPRCEGADGPDCFTSNQMAVLERLYGDVTRHGKRYFPGWPVGSEAAGPNGQSAWIGQHIDTPSGQSAWNGYAGGFIRFILGPGTPLAAAQTDAEAMQKFDFEKDYDNLAFARQVLDATDPDLTAYRRRGGKLLIYFGWADPQLNPRMGLEYYEDVMGKMGPSTPEFARLFMVPGMFHCGGGIGASTFDSATPLVHWVEQGEAPASIPAARMVSGKAVRTRPLCPWPQVARYKGSGSIDDAANFTCRLPD